MTMAEQLANVLIAYTAVMATVISGIMAFMLYHFLPVKSRVDTMWRELYGGDTGGGGALNDAEGERESMREMLDDAEGEHRRMSARLARVVAYLRDLSDHVDEDDDEAPHIIDDDYIDSQNEDGRYYRGD